LHCFQEIVLLRNSKRNLLKIMKSIHKSCYETAEAYGKKGDYVTGATLPVSPRLPTQCWLTVLSSSSLDSPPGVCWGRD